MAKISTYPEIGTPTLGDLLIGTDVSNDNETKNFTVSSILALGQSGGIFVPYTGANNNVDLGTYVLSTSQLYTNQVIPQTGDILYVGGQSNGFGVKVDLDLSSVSIGDYTGDRNGTSFAIDDANGYIYSVFEGDVNGISLAPTFVTLGDISGLYSSIVNVIDNTSKAIYTKIGADFKGYFLDFDNSDYYFGDIGQTNNGTTFVISDSQNIIATGKGTIFQSFNPSGLLIDLATSNPIVSMGDFASIGNGTFMTVNDLSERLVLSDNCAVEVSNGVGSTGQVLISQGAGATPIWSNPTSLETYYGSFYDTTTQTISANTNKAMEFDSTDSSITSGFTIGNNLLGRPTRITAANAGNYNLQFSAQLHKTAGGGATQVYIWFVKNDIDLANSASVVTLANNGDLLIAAWNYTLSLGAGEYVEIFWRSTSASMELQRNTTVSGVPSIPSVIATITHI